jgi:hypothetical protein
MPDSPRTLPSSEWPSEKAGRGNRAFSRYRDRSNLIDGQPRIFDALIYWYD